ncbi:MAG TPA: YggT family protein [Gammaproteobacteria bacterium]|nr:YggT family protein [Gammaproteobacteria bacterium]
MQHVSVQKNSQQNWGNIPMNSYFSEAGLFLIDVFFSFFILMVMLRFILQWVRADFYNPISQFIVKLTNPVLKPFRRLIPGLAGIDMASIVLMLTLKFIAVLLTFALSGLPLHILIVLILSITGLIKLALYVFIFAIIIMAVASWIAPGAHSPVLGLIDQIIAPLMRPIQRWIKPVSGMDFSPLIALLILNLIIIAVPHLQNGLLSLFK